MYFRYFVEKVATIAIEIVQRRWTSSFAVYESLLFRVKLSFFLSFFFFFFFRAEDGNRRDSKSRAFAPVSKEFLRSRKRPSIAILGPVWVSGALNARNGRWMAQWDIFAFLFRNERVTWRFWDIRAGWGTRTICSFITCNSQSVGANI